MAKEGIYNIFKVLIYKKVRERERERERERDEKEVDEEEDGHAAVLCNTKKK